MINWQHIKQELESINLGLSKIEASKYSSYNWAEKTETILENQAYQLLRYRIDAKGKRAVLLVYSWVNSPDILDFNEETSLVNIYKDLGFDVFLIKWQLTDLDKDRLSVEPYYTAYIAQAIQVIKDKGFAECHLNGICQGGAFALAYAALYPNTVSSVILMMSPIDHSDKTTLLYKLSQKLMAMIGAQHTIPGIYLQCFFSMLKPSQYYLGRVIDAASRKHIKEYKIIEAWLNKTPDMPTQLLKSYVQYFVEENALISGEINVANITCPVINIYAKHDRLVPPRSSIVIAKLLRCQYLSCEIEGGHLSILSDQQQQAIVKKFMQNSFLGAQ